MHSPSPSPFLRSTLAVVSVFLLACGGGDSPTPPDPDPDPTGQTVTVQVTTAGTDLDADGYTVRLGTRSASVEANGTATFAKVAPGSYEVRLQGVAGNCLPGGGEVRNVTVGASPAEVAFAVECHFDFGDGLPTEACGSLAPATASGAPLDSIPLGRLPSGFGTTVVARTTTPDRVATGFAFLRVDSTGNAALAVPVHPTGDPDGGTIVVRVIDGDRACIPFDFKIEPLPEAPGEFEAIVGLLQEILTAQAALLGTTPTELRSTPIDQVDDARIPVAVLQYVLDHPDNERSLARAAVGAVPGGPELELADPLLARTGLRQALQASSAVARRAVGSPARDLGTQTCTPDQIRTTETAILSSCMGTQASEAFRLEGASGRVLNDLVSVFGYLEFVPGLVGGSAGVMGSLFWFVLNERERTAALLPCCFKEITLEQDIVVFEEDSPRTGSWSARVTAVNQGWDLGKELLEAALKIANIAAATDDSQIYGPEIPSVIAAAITGPFADALLGEVSIEDWRIPVEEFGPVPISSEEWSKVTYVGGSVDSVAHNTYEAKAVGSTMMGVRTRPEDGHFGGKVAQAIVELRVDSIEIMVEPADTFVAPDEVKTFRVEVRNAYFPDSIDVQVDRGDATVSDGSNGRYNVLYVAPPTAEFSNPADLQVYHTATSGARENGPPRNGKATIRFGKVRITPRPVCLDTSEQKTFSAEVEGPDNTEVEWTADFGVMGQDGDYRAPSSRPESGYVTIRAESEEYPALADEIVIPIGCQCQYTLNVDGYSVVGQPGDLVSFTDWGGPDEPYGNDYELFSVQVSRPSAGWSTTVFPLEDDPATWPGGVGTSEGIRIQGDMGLTLPADLLYASVDTLPKHITIDEYTPEVSVRGSAYAQTVQILSSQFPFSRESPLSMTFSVTVPPGTARGPVLPPWGYRFACMIPGG